MATTLSKQQQRVIEATEAARKAAQALAEAERGLRDAQKAAADEAGSREEAIQKQLRAYEDLDMLDVAELDAALQVAVEIEARRLLRRQNIEDATGRQIDPAGFLIALRVDIADSAVNVWRSWARTYRNG